MACRRAGVTHVCASKLTINGSDNGLSPGRRQAIIWTNAGILLRRTSNLRDTFQCNFKGNSYIFIQENAFQNVVCEMVAILSHPQCGKESVDATDWENIGIFCDSI